jgi:hypothetical protein
MLPTLSNSQLATVSGGAAPNVNNLAAWGIGPSGPSGPSGGGSSNPSGISAQDIMNAKPADNRVIDGPSSNRFSSPDMRATSPQDNSWMNRIPDMYGQLGM